MFSMSYVTALIFDFEREGTHHKFKFNIIGVFFSFLASIRFRRGKVWNMHIRYMLFKFFFATKYLDTVLAVVHSITTMDIHLMFDNFGLKCPQCFLLCAICLWWAWTGGCSYTPIDLALSISFLARNSALNFEFRGLVLNL